MIVLELQYQGRRRRISSDRDTITIGSGKTCDVRIDEPGIAERHCTLRKDQVKRQGRRGTKTVLLLEDHQASDEPTRINGFETIKAQVSTGDVIEIGPASITVRGTDSRTATAVGGPSRDAESGVEATAEPAVLAATVAAPARARTRSAPRNPELEQAPEGFSKLMIGLLGCTVAAIVLLVALTTTSRRDTTTQPTRTTSQVPDRGTPATPFTGPNDPATHTPDRGRPGATAPGTTGAAGPRTAAPDATAGARGPTELSSTEARPSPDRAPTAGASTAPVEPLTKKQIYLRALSADRLAQQNDFARAAEDYRILHESTDDDRLRAELADRITDLSRLAEGVAHLTARLASGPADAPSIHVGGASARVIGTAAGGIRIAVPSGERGMTWGQVPPRAMERLLRWAHDGAEADLIAGRYLFEFKARFEDDPGLERACHACLQRALEIAPTRKEEVDGILRRGLGVTTEKGFVLFEGRFMTAERRDRLVAVRLAKAQLENLTSSRAEVRRQAYDYLRKVDDLEIYRSFRQALQARRLALGATLVNSAAGKKLVALRAEKSKFLTKRKVLMDRIFDLKEYPYPYRVERGASQEDYQRYIASQKIIDDRTRALRKVWASAKGSFTLGKAFLDQYAVLREVELELEKFPPDEVPPAESLAPLLALGDPEFLTEHYRGKMTIASLPMDVLERARLEYTARVMAFNAKLECNATKAERQQVQVTNEYRHMLGRHALILNPKLLESARGHSRDMVLKGYFSHTAPDPERRTPAHRIRLAGYTPVNASENIARGSSGPETVHDRWCHSSGHHRNLLGERWHEMGSGNVGAFWTQNFASQGKDFYKLHPQKNDG